MKLFSIAACFLAGAIGITLVGWVVSLTPFFLRAGIYALALSVLIYASLWALDDPISQALDLTIPHYYAGLVALGLSIVMSIAVLVGVLTNGG